MLERITTILQDTYGKSAMTNALAVVLANDIPTYGEDRERQVRDACWTFFSGGSTAEYVAHEIEHVLKQTSTGLDNPDEIR